jgi:hypothetical protein
MIWDVTESAITIIAASIPVLRVLVRDVRSSARQYRMTDDHNTTGRNGTKPGTQATRIKSLATATGAHGGDGDDDENTPDSSDGRHTPSKPADARSDKSILDADPRKPVRSQQQRQPESSILRTQAVSIEYSPRGRGESMELGRIPR